MYPGLGRLAGIAVVVVAALVVPVISISPPAASADTVLDGCTIVSNPSATDFTNCPNTNFTGEDLLGINLDYANLAGSNFSNAQLAQCVFVGPPTLQFSCSNATFEHATLSHATFTEATMSSCASVQSTPTITSWDCTGADFANANLQSSTLTYINLSEAGLSSADLVGANIGHVTFVETLQIAPGVAYYYDGTNFTGADLAGLNLSGFDLSFTTLTRANLTGAQLQGANLSSVTESGVTIGGALSQSNLTNANLTNANLSGATLTGATLTGANFTGTILVPSNQTVPATSQAGATMTWTTPAGLPGATPGTCTPASGLTFPLFTTTVTCQILDDNNGVATGTFQVTVQPTSQYFTRVLVPATGATLTGNVVLDAGASDAAGITSVAFELTGGILNNQIIATATPSLYGWLVQWNSASVPSGTYNLESVATDATHNTDTSSPISVTVSNQPLSTAVLIPSGGADVSGASSLLDASASGPASITSVTFEVSGGTLSDQVVATAVPTYYGWLAQWNTTKVPNGTYALQSVATDSRGMSTSSASVTIAVTNAPPTATVLIPAAGATQSGTSAILDASASSQVTKVVYELSGGPTNLNNQVIATGVPTYYGWLAQWNTTSVPDGTYALTSVASYGGGLSGPSPPITITIGN